MQMSMCAAEHRCGHRSARRRLTAAVTVSMALVFAAPAEAHQATAPPAGPVADASAVPAPAVMPAAPSGTVWREIPPAPASDATWLEQLNWWRSLGAGVDGSAYPSVTNLPADDVGPRNHVDYLADIAAKGSTYCGHGQDDTFPRTTGVTYDHNVLFCGVSDLVRAVDGWLNTPYHGPPLLAPGVARVGAAASRVASAAVTAATTPRSTTYLWPADGGVMPRLEMAVGESPEPRDVCPPIGRNPGQPFYAFFPNARTLVSATVAVQGAQVPFCILGWSGALAAGDELATAIFFTKQPFAVGDVVTASVTTTDTDGSDTQTLEWTFRVATPPGVAYPAVIGVPGGVSVTSREPLAATGLPLTGAHVRVERVSDRQIVADVDVAASSPAFVPLPAGTYTVFYSARNALGWSARSGTAVTVAAPALPPVTPDAGFEAVDPVRLLDTRLPGAPFGRLQPGATAVLDLREVMPADATAVAVNLAAVGAAADGWVRAYACSGAVPATSSLNPERGRVTVTGAVVSVGDGRICFQTWSATDLVVDLNGWLTRSATAGLVLGEQRRVLDTREAVSPIQRLAAGQSVSVQVAAPGSATTAVALNITAVDPSADGYVTAWPCDAARPLVSNLNPIAGVTRPNLANVRVSATGTVCLYSLRETDLVVDVLGRYETGAAARYAAIDPIRLIDTREQLQQMVPLMGDVPVAAVGVGDVLAVQGTITATTNWQDGYLAAYACALGPWPGTANVNFRVGETKGNGALMPVAGGYSCLRLYRSGSFVVDVSGFWDVP